MKKMKLAYIAVAGAVALTSCNDFLDKMPDNRVDPQAIRSPIMQNLANSAATTSSTTTLPMRMACVTT